MNRAMAYPAREIPLGVDLSIDLDGVALVAVSAPTDLRAGTIAARAAAASAAGVDAEQLEVVRRQAASPAVLRMFPDGRLRALDVALSLSHRLGHAVAAAYEGQLPLGIDLERRGAVPAGLERLFLGRSERGLLWWHEAETLWAMKEAAWKALRLDRSVPFHALELVCDDGKLRALRSPAGVVQARAALWRPWPRFVAALVWLP